MVAPEFSADLDRRDLESLRAMRAECSSIENAVSYTRRLAQGRFEIRELPAGRYTMTASKGGFV